jgi:flagellin-like protein
MEKKLMFNYSKRGLSEVVTTVIIIAVSIVAVVMVWGFISGFINEQIKDSQSCFGNYNKVNLNKMYTCYEPLMNGGYKFRFSISIGDIEVDKLIVYVYSNSSVKSYTLTNEIQTTEGLSLYPSGESEVVLPQKNSGITYQATGFVDKIDSISIAPVIGGSQCEVSDSYSEIDNCYSIIE